MCEAIAMFTNVMTIYRFKINPKERQVLERIHIKSSKHDLICFGRKMSHATYSP